MRSLPILLVFVLVAAPVAQAQSVPELENAYPEPVHQAAERAVEDASERSLPNGTLSGQAISHLEDARERLEEDRVRSAFDALILFHVRHEADALLAEVDNATPGEGRQAVQDARQDLLEQVRQASGGAREVVEQLDVDELTVEGAETAIWGSVLVARGEYRLNTYSMLTPRDPYPNGTLSEERVRVSLSPLVSARTFADLGARVAAIAPSVGGNSPNDTALSDRVLEVANADVSVPGRSNAQEYLPRASPDASPLLRAGLTVFAGQELKAEDRQRLLSVNADKGNVTELAENWIAHGREKVSPWAAQGSPLAGSALEGVLGVNGTVSDEPSRAWAAVARSQAYALAVHGAEDKLRGDEEPVQQETPFPVPGLILALGASAVVFSFTRRAGVHRTRLSDGWDP